MTSARGFGPPKPARKKKKVSAGAKRRQEAASKYDEMKGSGFPEFNIFVRDRDKPKQWIPVGSVAVKRSAAISAAIFQNEDELLKGAFRLYPRLAKKRENLEYGYRLKDELYADEPITVAAPPPTKAVGNLANKVKGGLGKLARKYLEWNDRRQAG